MSTAIDINVHHVTRVEGHGNIVLSVRDGEIRELRLDIVESPRFFEVMLRGRPFEEAQHITCRICGICAIGHTTASLRATEDALGITPSEQTVELRKLLLNAEMMQSHVLHIFFLAAPDFFGAPDVLPLAASHREAVGIALRLKRMANQVAAIIGGRHIHPISAVVNGFSKWPERKELEEIRRLLEDRRADLEQAVAFAETLTQPRLDAVNEFVSLKSAAEYAYYDGEICSTAGDRLAPRDYLQKVRESVVQHATAKHVDGGAGPFMVGALARLNNNFDQLHPWARGLAEKIGLRPPVHNPFHNNTAQLIETVHCYEDSLLRVDRLLRDGVRNESPKVQPTRFGRGVGAVEVPRGTLYHEYDIGEDGRIRHANCIIPTGQNLAHIEKSMRDLVPTILDRSRDEMTLLMEMLVRAYDPCISCSTHFLKVDFVE